MGRGHMPTEHGDDHDVVAPAPAAAAVFCGTCGEDIDVDKEDYITVDCTITDCRAAHHCQCVVDFLMQRAAELGNKNSQRRYEISALKRPTMLLQQHWRCPCAYTARGGETRAEPCPGFTLGGEVRKPRARQEAAAAAAAAAAAGVVRSKNAALPAASGGLSKKGGKFRQLGSSTATSAQLSGVGSLKSGAAAALSHRLSSAGLLGSEGGAGAQPKTFAAEQEELARKAKAEEREARRRAAQAGNRGAAPAPQPVPVPVPVPYIAAAPVRPAGAVASAKLLPSGGGTNWRLCFEALMDMGFSAEQAAAATDSAGGDVNTAVQALMLSGATAGDPGGDAAPAFGAAWASQGDSAPPEWSAPAPAGAWWSGGDGMADTPPASDAWAAGSYQQGAADAASGADGWPAEGAAAADTAVWLPPVDERPPPPEDEVDELMLMLGIAA